MNQQRSIEVSPQRVPLTIRDVEMLDRQGAFDGYGKVELIGGELLYVNAQYRRHIVVKSELAYRLRRALEVAGSDLFVGTEGSIALGERDLPQPDILLTSASAGDGAVPGESIALLVEVADAALSFDLGRKLAMYAGASVPEYWVVDIEGRIIHQMWHPIGHAYAERRTVPFDQSITAESIADVVIGTEAL